MNVLRKLNIWTFRDKLKFGPTKFHRINWALPRPRYYNILPWQTQSHSLFFIDASSVTFSIVARDLLSWRVWQKSSSKTLALWVLFRRSYFRQHFVIFQKLKILPVLGTILWVSAYSQNILRTRATRTLQLIQSYWDFRKVVYKQTGSVPASVQRLWIQQGIHNNMYVPTSPKNNHELSHWIFNKLYNVGFIG